MHPPSADEDKNEASLEAGVGMLGSNNRFCNEGGLPSHEQERQR